MNNVMQDQELTALIEQYDELKWSSVKNLTEEILSITSYINLIEEDVMPIIEEEYNKISKFILNINTNYLLYPENVDLITVSLKRLIPIYFRISTLIVDPNCESINNDLRYELRKIIDGIYLLASPIYNKQKSDMKIEQILQISKIDFTRNYKLTQIKSGLKQLQSKEKEFKKNPSKLNLYKLLNKWSPRILLIFVIILLIAHKYGPQNYILDLDNILKIIGWATVILWMPFYFLRTLHFRSRLVIPLIASAIICIWFSYGLLKGAILVIILIIYPLGMVLSPRSDSIYESEDIRNALFKPTAISLGLAFIVTREPIWIIGLLIWLIWIYTSYLSYRYFRPTFDNISRWDRTELIKDLWIFGALTASCILIILIASGPISGNFLSNIYIISSQIAITLVGFLLAVQGFLGSTSLKSEGEKEIRIEMEMILRSMEGLKGFMSIFTLLFIISMIGVLSSKNMSNLNMSIEWLTNPIDPIHDDIFELFKTSLFASYITILSLSVSYLYYLFLSGNLIVLPFRSRLLSKPVYIEKFTNLTDGPNSVQYKDLERALFSEHKLNGRILQEVLINKIDEGLYANCKIEVAFPDKQDLMSLSIAIGNALITKIGFTKVDIWAVSKQGRSGIIKVFQVELDNEKITFLDKNSSMDLEYKFKQIGAHFQNFAYKESQLI